MRNQESENCHCKNVYIFFVWIVILCRQHDKRSDMLLMPMFAVCPLCRLNYFASELVNVNVPRQKLMNDAAKKVNYVKLRLVPVLTLSNIVLLVGFTETFKSSSSKLISSLCNYLQRVVLPSTRTWNSIRQLSVFS